MESFVYVKNGSFLYYKVKLMFKLPTLILPLIFL